MHQKDVMNKEIQNYQEFYEFLEHKREIEFLSNACSVFSADVHYADDDLEDICLKNVTIRWQHKYDDSLTIPVLSPPYYSDFKFRLQDFKFIEESLVITGIHSDNPSKCYKITIK